MSSTCTGKSSSEPKKKRKIMTVNEKVHLLDILQARHYQLNELTVRYIKKRQIENPQDCLNIVLQEH